VSLDIAEGETIVLDTSVLIAYLNLSEGVSEAATYILDQLVATERSPAWISSVTIGEVLVRPLRQLGRVPDHTETFLLDFPGLSVRSVDFLVAAEAADIRAKTELTLADALIAATATVTSSPWLITNDAAMASELRKFKWDTRVLLLSDVAQATE
jgi:predicted nucleic acid-binding protein